MKKLPSYFIHLLIITLVIILGVEGLCWKFRAYFTQNIISKQQATPSTTPKDISPPPSTPLNTAQTESTIILTRQLFGPSLGGSTIVTEPENTPAQPTMTDIDIVLMGTIGITHGEGKAIILDKQDNTQQIYQKGDAVRGIFIKEILRGRVLLSRNGKDGFLEMNESMKYTPNLPTAGEGSPVPAEKATQKATKVRGARSSS